MADVNEVALYGLTDADDRFVMYTGSTAANINNKIITGDVRHNDADFAAMVSTGTVDTLLGKATFNADGTITFTLAADAATRMGAGTGPVKDFVTYEYQDSNNQIHQKVLEVVVVRDPAGKWDSPNDIDGETQQMYLNINSGSNASLTQGLTQGDDTLRGSSQLANAKVDFGDGNDVLQLTNASHGTLSNSVVDMGDGNNLVEISAGAAVSNGTWYSTVMYQSTLVTGGGNDTLSLTGGAGYYMFWGSRLETGAGDDSVSLVSVYTGAYEAVVIGYDKAAYIDLGTGNDTLFINAKSATYGAVRSYNQNVTINTGIGDDSIIIQSPTLAIGNDYKDTSLLLSSGDGNDTMTLMGGIQGLNFAARAKTVVDLGADDDVLTLTSTGATSAITNATVLGGAGNDAMRITSAAALSGAVVNGDDGNDFIHISTGAAMVNTAINGGAGTDFVRLESTVLQGTVMGAGSTLTGGTDAAGDLIDRPAGDDVSHAIGDVLSLNRNLSIDSHGTALSASGTGTFNFGGINATNATQFEALHLDYTGGTGRDMIDIDSVLAGITAKGLDCAMKSLVFTGDSADRYTLPAGWTQVGTGISLAG
ncbi:hypothetical protein, partial [Desulfovibrio cuneatus]|uniref:hypothetical protein n=1 Tax=Desulfovibrio cuneatus TaxID=159728 RepID=UPI0004841AA3